MTVIPAPSFEHVTETGQLPADVRDPTLQAHDTTPLAPATFSPRPEAVDGPDLYSTRIVQVAPAFVLTVAVAFDPGDTGEVSDVNSTLKVPLGVG